MKFALRLPRSPSLRPSRFARSPSRARVALVATAALALTVLTTNAQVAKNAVREKIAGLELVVLKTGVKEVVTIRGFAPGEYTVNVQYYDSKNEEPVEANVSVVKVNPKAEISYYGTIKLERKGDEKTAVRFTVDSEGIVSNINTLPKQLAPQS